MKVLGVYLDGRLRHRTLSQEIGSIHAVCQSRGDCGCGCTPVLSIPYRQLATRPEGSFLTGMDVGSHYSHEPNREILY
jgi:hypothetical protein